MYSPMSWQKPARIAVAIVGLTSAAGVYFVMGERRVAPPAAPIEARDPEAIVEISGAILKNFPGVEKDFQFEGRISYYPDGTKRLTEEHGKPVRISVHRRDGRTFTVTGKEAEFSKDENVVEMTGSPVRLEANDGFWLETERATVSRLDQITHIPGTATFGKGRMTGSGTGFNYDDSTQILLIARQARVRTVDDRGRLVTDLASSSAMLDRLQHRLTLDTGVHVIREDQIIDTDHASGHLSDSNDIVTLIELFGNSRVSGGASIDEMKARDITLDYTDDGKTLEASKLAGEASVAMKGTGEGPGRRIEGEVVDVTLAPDGTLTSVTARPGQGRHVQLDLPATADSPAKTITAQTLDGTGQPGKGLTHVVLERDVLYSEGPLRSGTAAADKQTGMRTARSQRLEASLADDAVTEATFSGETTFEEAGLKACAARAGYNPRKGTLALSGATRAGAPMVADEQLAIEAMTIDVALETRKMTALGSQTQNLTTFMRSSKVQRCRPSTERPASQRGANNVPRLLKSDTATTIIVSAEEPAGRAPRLEYDSEKGVAVYTGGRATLTQEDTSIVANRLVLDQNTADLTATGTAITRMRIDDKMNEGRGHEVRYLDKTRELTYSSQPKTPGAEVSLRSPGESTLRAGNIVIILAAKENKAETVRARGNVRLLDGPQNVTGTSLDYTASNEQFVVRGERGKPAAAASLEDGKCRNSVADSIRFHKGSSNVELRGGPSRSTTAPSGSGTCTPSAPASPSTR